MKIPSRIYKYQPPTPHPALSNLEAGGFWCSDPSKFNDPFDCAEELIKKKVSSSPGEIYGDAFRKFDGAEMMEHAIDIVTAEKNEGEDFSPAKTYARSRFAKCKGVACFSERRDDLLMWGHYAAGHSGFCLEFDTSCDLFKNQLLQVIYETKIPTRKALAKKLGTPFDVTSFLLVKAKEWKYEKEWRLLRERSNELVAYPREALTAIYFGTKISPDDRRRITSAVKHSNTKLFQFQMSNNSFKLEEAMSNSAARGGPDVALNVG